MGTTVTHVTASTAEFAALLPAERSRIAGLGRALRAALTALPPPRLGLTHGDFHGDNILVDGTRVGLVDLEDCAMGDPADDVGSNWAQLRWHAFRAGARTPIPNLGRRAFLEAYLELTDAETAARVPTYAAMDAFQAALPGFGSGGLLIDGCRIVHTRYRTSRAERREGKAFLSVCYALDVRDLARARRGTQLVHGKAYGTADSRRQFAEAKARHRLEPSLGEAVAHLADLDLVVWAFPNDPKLPHLPE